MNSIQNQARQLTEAGELRHLLTLDGLDRNMVTALLERATGYLRPSGTRPATDNALAGSTVANLFFEPSTRTRASFELAAKRMNADVLNLDVNTSSRIKGESILDTIYTLQAMQVDVFVIRDASAGVSAMIANHVEPHVSVLNAGEANISHPTQGLLDILTIQQHNPCFESLTVTIVGDIAHSRVACSAVQGLRIMGTSDIRLVSPPGLEPDMADFPGSKFTHDIDSAIKDSDVVMALRVQKERIVKESDLITNEQYLLQYGLTAERMKQAKPDAIVMHPGPMNRNVEITDEVADSDQSVIEQQVTNGLAIRMAILATITETRKKG